MSGAKWSKEACKLFSSVHAAHDCYLHDPKWQLWFRFWWYL